MYLERAHPAFLTTLVVLVFILFCKILQEQVFFGNLCDKSFNSFDNLLVSCKILKETEMNRGPQIVTVALIASILLIIFMSMWFIFDLFDEKVMFWGVQIGELYHFWIF